MPSLAKGIKDRLAKIPLDRSFQTFGKKQRARGRIANAFPALIPQPEYSSSRSERGFTSSKTDDPPFFVVQPITRTEIDVYFAMDVTWAFTKSAWFYILRRYLMVIGIVRKTTSAWACH